MPGKWTGLLLLGAVAVAACSENAAPTANSSDAVLPEFTRSSAPLAGTPTERAAQIVARINARFEASGSTKRLDDVHFFTTNSHTPDFRRLRTGSRWPNPRSVSFAIDQKPDEIVKHTSLKPGSYDFEDRDIIAAVRSAFERYNHVDNIVLHSTELAGYSGFDENGDPLNDDILDKITRNDEGECVDIVDDASPRLISWDPASRSIEFEPLVDNLFGGWLSPEYFQDCLGSADIIGVTYTISDVDGGLGEGTDGYPDRLYTEQYYNTRFHWNVTGSKFLDTDPEAEFDVESIVTHEVGHAHGLGHFGGPNPNQLLTLHQHDRIFSPEAVMNPFYIGGEKRELLPTDIAGLRALYASKNLR